VTRDEVLAILREHRAEIAAFGVVSLALFGSVARGEAGPASDIDILIEFGPDAHVGIFQFTDLQDYLERLLGRRVDLVTRTALKPQLRDRILKEAVDVAA